MIKVRNDYTDEEARRFVEKCDAAFFDRLGAVCNEISETKGLNVIGLTGPTCSGKTTMANMLINRLGSAGKRVHVISLDDFFLERDVLDARSVNGEIDYDSPDTIDVDLLHECAEEIIRGDRVVLPKYDFPTGSRGIGDIIDADDDDMFVFEGIQVLYPSVVSILKSNTAYRSIYICPRSEIGIDGKVFEPNEIRFLRRIVRDFNFRAASADFSFYLWDSVRKNEEEHIFPNADSCDHIIDSTLGYDVNMLAPYLKRILSMPHSRRGKITNAEYENTVNYILDKISGIEEMKKEYLLSGSLYREFI